MQEVYHVSTCYYVSTTELCPISTLKTESE